MLTEQASQPALERAPASHGWMPGDKEHNLFGHEAEDGVDIAGGCGLVPQRDEISNGLFVGAHANSLSDTRGFQCLHP